MGSHPPAFFTLPTIEIMDMVQFLDKTPDLLSQDFNGLKNCLCLSDPILSSNTNTGTPWYRMYYTVNTAKLKAEYHTPHHPEVELLQLLFFQLFIAF